MPSYSVGTITKPAYVSTVINELARLLVNETASDRERRIDDAVNTINSLIIPRAYVAIENRHELHVVVIEPKGTPLRETFVLSTSLNYAAHVVWKFDPLNDEWRILKQRDKQDPSVHPVFKVR